jgi:hypothetical protein
MHNRNKWTVNKLHEIWTHTETVAQNTYIIIILSLVQQTHLHQPQYHISVCWSLHYLYIHGQRTIFSHWSALSDAFLRLTFWSRDMLYARVHVSSPSGEGGILTGVVGLPFPFVLCGGVIIPGTWWLRSGLARDDIIMSAWRCWAFSSRTKSTACVWILCVFSDAIPGKYLSSTDPDSRNAIAYGAIHCTHGAISIHW